MPSHRLLWVKSGRVIARRECRLLTHSGHVNWKPMPGPSSATFRDDKAIRAIWSYMLVKPCVLGRLYEMAHRIGQLARCVRLREELTTRYHWQQDIQARCIQNAKVRP